MKRALVVYLVLGAGIVVQQAYYYPKLPDRVASHFDGSGQPDGWMPRRSLVARTVGSSFFIIAAFLGAELFLLVVPPKHVLPRDRYLVAPKQREATYRALRLMFLGYGSAMLLFVSGYFQSIVQANLRADRWLLNWSGVLFALWLAFLLVIWPLLAGLRFPRRPGQRR
jgi:uncharacterized membrane protein